MRLAKRKEIKKIMAVLLGIAMIGWAVPASSSQSNAMEIEEMLVTPSKTANPIAAVRQEESNDMMPASARDYVYDVGTIYYGNGGITNIYSLNNSTRVYCGDHDKAAAPSSGVEVVISNTENGSLSQTVKENLRKTLYYADVYSFSTPDVKVASVHQALNYFKNGGNRPDYASDFVSYVEAASSVLSSDDARMWCIGSSNYTENVLNTSGTHTKTKMETVISTDTPDGSELKKTSLITVHGSYEPDNSFTVTIPQGVTIWVYKYNQTIGMTSYATGGIKDYDVKINGVASATLHAGDQFILTAPVSKTGHSAIDETAVKLGGYDVMQCYHDDNYQTWYYLGNPVTYSVSMDINWGEKVPEESTVSISLKKTSTNSSISSGNCHSLEGAVYDVYHISDTSDYYTAYGSTGVLVGRFITNANGTGVVQDEYCKTDGGYHVSSSVLKGYLKGLPQGYYRIQEVKAPTGFVLNKECTIVDLSENSGQIKVDLIEKDIPKNDSTGIIIYKRDKDTGEKVQGSASLEGAEFTIKYYDAYYDSISELPADATRTWILKTDESGICSLSSKYIISGQSDELYFNENNDAVIPLGTITIEETKAPEGYTLENLTFTSVKTDSIVTDVNGVYLTKITESDSLGIIAGGNEYIVSDYVARGDLEFTKTNDTGSPLANVEFSITSKTTGESHIVWTDAEGYYSTAASYIPHTENTNRGEAGVGIWFGDGDVDDTKGALPYDTYIIKELRCKANVDTYKTAEPVEVVISENGTAVTVGEIVDERFPEIHTTAKDSVTNSHISSVLEDEVTVIDTVDMTGLDIGHTYAISGVIMDQETGAPLQVVDGDVTGAATFTALDEEMSVDVEFLFSPKGLEGKTIVIFEQLTDTTYPNEIIAKHEDMNDEDQMIYFVSLHTTALDSETGIHTAYPDEEVTIIDTVFYENLVIGEEYTVSGKLMRVDTGEALLIDGEEVTQSVTFVAEQKKGSVELCYSLDAVALMGVTTVVFEDLYYDGYKVYSHADLADENQQINFPKLGTTATDASDGDHTLSAGTTVTVVDTMDYENLALGETYKVVGKILDQDTGELILVDGEEITAEMTFIPEKMDGFVDIAFTFDTTGLEGKRLVVFEYVYGGENMDKLVASHEELESVDQTVVIEISEIPETPKTGDIFPIMQFSVILAFGIISIIVIYVFKRKETMRSIDVNEQSEQ